jgi:hypothetical protein
MKKSELKAIIKETIKECLTEVLLENRVFSNLISEVMKNTQRMVLENSSPTVNPPKRQVVAEPSRYKEIANNLSLRNRGEFHKETVSHVREEPKYGESASAFDVMSSIREPADSNEMGAFGRLEEMAEAVNVIPSKTLDILFSNKKLI